MVPVAVVQMTTEGGTLMAHRSSWLGVLEVMRRHEGYRSMATTIRPDLPPDEVEGDPVVTIRLARYVADAVLNVAGRHETARRVNATEEG